LPERRTLLCSLRVEHPAFGTPSELAADLVELANRLGCPIVCRVNNGAEMFASPGSDPDTVVAAWRATLSR